MHTIHILTPHMHAYDLHMHTTNADAGIMVIITEMSSNSCQGYVYFNVFRKGMKSLLPLVVDQITGLIGFTSYSGGQPI